jgi:hypothetical protein
MVDSRFDADVFSVDQLIRPIGNLYRVRANGQPVAFVRQKRLAVKEEIAFHGDDHESLELFRVKARKVLELGGSYDVTAPDGERIGTLEKVFGTSLLRSTWRVLDGEGQEVARVQERSLPVALFRRIVDWLPFGELVPVIFHFTIDAGDLHLGDFTRAWGVRDAYTLDLSADQERLLDRRLGVALAVGLDALQSR